MLSRRLISGVCIGGLVMAAIIWLPWPALLLVLLAVGLLCHAEFILLTCCTRRDKGSLRILLVTGQALLLAAFFESRGQVGFLTPLVLVAGFMILLVRGFRNPGEDILRQAAFGVASLVYVSVCMGFMARLVWSDWAGAGTAWPVMPMSGRLLILYVIWVVKFTDIGAYAFGMTLGQRKLCPRISPGKTWEGFWGGILVGLGASCLAVYLIRRVVPALPLNSIDALVLGLLLPVCGVLGDLCESVVKRSLGVKDSGQLIPGMGGVLDVLDSLLFAAPFLFLYLQVRSL